MHRIVDDTLQLDVTDGDSPDPYGSSALYFWSLNTSGLQVSPDRDLAPPLAYEFNTTAWSWIENANLSGYYVLHRSYRLSYDL